MTAREAALALQEAGLDIGERELRWLARNGRIPGAQLLQGKGSVQAWDLPPEALERISPAEIEAARQALQAPAATATAAPSAVPRAVEADPDIVAARKRTALMEISNQELRAEEERLRREQEIRRLRGDGRDRDDAGPLIAKLIERLDQRPDPAAEALRRELEECAGSWSRPTPSGRLRWWRN